jgi:hypothetical protein
MGVVNGKRVEPINDRGGCRPRILIMNNGNF